VPYTVFLTPALSRVGLTERQAREKILGAALFSIDSQELINLVAFAVKRGITATKLRDGIYTHPSSTEAFNEVLTTLS
jgi:pyruvate/2-oxoglutarate dehydrogenase complex dihydrolipoamide dehydrogenase (E3) component